MRIIIIFLVIVITSAAQAQQINLPSSIRKDNWVGSSGEGSCVHAATIMLFRYQRQYALADYWQAHYENGETWAGIIGKLEKLKIRWAGTYSNNDVKFLEWAIRTRRGCMVTTQQGAHMILLVHLDKDKAGILDSNNTKGVIWKSRAQFLAEWNASNSWAMTPVYTPPPPSPRKGK